VIKAFVPTVVPWLKSLMSLTGIPAARIPARIPLAGSSGTDGTFVTEIPPLPSSKTKMSVNVPPTSTATR
jgi:hypothetical protein